MSPSAVVLLVSGTDTVPILETAHINRSLRRRRWFARDVIGVEGSLRRSAKASKFAQVAALTTVTFLADNDTPRDADLRSQFFESYVEPDTPSLSVFRSALAYESLMLLHRAFTSSQYHGYSDILDAFHTEGPFSRKPPRRLSGILATHTFKSANHAAAVDSIPRTGWVAENTIRVNTTSNGSISVELKPIR